MENGEIVVLSADGVTIMTPAGEVLERAVQTVDWDEETAEKGGYETFMLKEIHEQADAVADAISDRTARGDGVDLDEQGALDEAMLRERETGRRRSVWHLLPRRPDRALRDRGVGAAAGRDGYRLGVPLPQSGRRRG